MKPYSNFKLCSAMAALCLGSCSTNPNSDSDPTAGELVNQAAAEIDQTEGKEASENESDGNHALSTDRFRLPDMQGLPSDSELTSSKPDVGSDGGVIARPPSE